MDTPHNRFDDHYPEIEILPEQLPELIFGLLNGGNPNWDEDEDDYGHDDDIPEEDDIDDEDITSWDDGEEGDNDDDGDDDDLHDDSEDFD